MKLNSQLIQLMKGKTMDCTCIGPRHREECETMVTEMHADGIHTYCPEGCEEE